MDVRIIEVLKGTEEKKTIRIGGDNGALCRPHVSHFPAGTRWVLAVSSLPERPIGDPSFQRGFTSPPGKREYAISVCGDFWLEVRGDRALGRITVETHSSFVESVSLSDLLSWVRSNGNAPQLSPTA